MTILASVNNKTVMPGITPIADVPDRPTIGTATAAGLAASITFTAATTGGTPTTYTATSNPGSITGTSATSPITVSGLTEDTSYTFTVTAGNSTGTSPASSASNSITAVSPITGGYDALATVLLPSSASTVTFAGIPSGYKHLQIRGIAFGTAAASGPLAYRLNQDSTASYSNHILGGNGAVSSAYPATSESYARLYGYYDNLSNTSFPLAVVLDILDYANTNKNTTGRVLSGMEKNGANYGEVFLFSNAWYNTNAVTSIEIFCSGQNLAVNSSFALYGVK